MNGPLPVPRTDYVRFHFDHILCVTTSTIEHRALAQHIIPDLVLSADLD